MDLLNNIFDYCSLFGDTSLLITTLFVCLYTIFKYGDENLGYSLRRVTVISYLIPLLVMLYFYDLNMATKSFIHDAYVVDLYSYMGKVAILILGLCSVLFNSTNKDQEDLSSNLYYPLAMLATIGCFVIISSNLLVYLMIGVAIVGICASFMVLLFSIGYSSYFKASGVFIITQLLSFALMVFGIAYFYSVTGNVYYADMAEWIKLNPSSHKALLLGIVILVPSLISICGAFPFSSIVLRVNSIPECVIVFLRTVVAVAVIMAVGRMLNIAFAPMSYMWKEFVLVLGIFGIVVGTIGTIVEDEIEKITSYCSISHIGFLLLALGIATDNSISAMLVYLMGYVLSYITFVGYGRGMYVNGKHLKYISDLRGFGSAMGAHSVVYALSAITYAGLPPFIIFIGKMSVMGAVLKWEFSYLLMILIIVGIFQGVWVLRLIREMYFSTATDTNENEDDDEGTLKIKTNRFTISVERGVKNTRRFAFVISVFFLFIAVWLMNLINQMSDSLS